MSRRKERKVSHDCKSSDDAFEGTSARTRPYSIEEIMINRKNKKVYQDHEIEAKGKEDNVDQKLELLPTDDDEKNRKCSSLGVRNKKSENILGIASRTKDRSVSLKLESVVVGKVGVSPAEPKVKSEVVSNTRDGETLQKRNAKDHKTIEEDELHYNNRENPIGYSHLKNSLPKRRSGDYRNEKLERGVKRKERNLNDQKSNDDYLKAEYKRKSKYLDGKDRFSEENEKAEGDYKPVYRNDLSKKKSDKDIVHKHVVSKRNSDISDRREKKCSPPLCEQPSKRVRRSSSREHKRDKDQKLSLHEVQNHTSKHRQSHAVSLSHSLKDRSEKHASEFHRSNKFTNGSTGHYRALNEPTDKLGGYSPRRRRSEDPTQSPPSKGISGKKRVGWDIPQTESHTMLTSALLPIASFQSKLSKIPQSVDVLAVSSSQPQSSSLNFNVQSALHIGPIDSVQLTQSTQPMRRLIIENVPSAVSEKDLRDCLNIFLLPSGVNFIQGTQPCFSCVIHAEKRQALVEFITAEYASAALSFKGSPLMGSDLKIRRPKDFIAVETAAHEKSEAVVNVVSDTVEDSPHKIFIGGISRNLSPKMLMEIVSAFGPLKAFKFFDKNDVDEPRAFLQYVDQSITAKACAGLNGMMLGGQTLTVTQATTNKPSSDIKCPPTYEIPDTAMPLLADPTEVLVLKNVFDPERFSSLSQQEIQEVLEDVRLECSRFGTVESIHVVASNPSNAASVEINDNDSGHSNSKVGSSNQMEKEDYDDFMKPDNPNIEEPPRFKTAPHSNNVTGIEKQVASDCTLSTELFPSMSEASDKPSTVIDEMGNTNNDAERNIYGHNLISVSESRHSLSMPAEPDASTETNAEQNNVQKGPTQLDGGLSSVLLPGSICIEYRRSEATCSAAHCFNGRAFDTRIVSVEYLPLDLYRRKFPK